MGYKLSTDQKRHLESLADPDLPDKAISILESRYLQRDDSREVVETPKEMFYRVASVIADVDKQYDPESTRKTTEDFYNLMVGKYFLPGSPTLRGAGLDLNLASCYVLPIEDSRDGIFRETLADAIEIQAFGGGVGFNFSPLRPSGSLIKGTMGEAKGPLGFIKIYDLAIGEVIAQGGVRQGASMGIINYNHPDIMQFIRAKLDGRSLRNFNLSVGVTEDFFGKALEGEEEYELIDHQNKVRGKLKAKEVLDEIVESAWKCGDPGVVFLDRIERDNPTPAVGGMDATNPCVAEGTLVNTPKGFLKVESLKVGDYISTVYNYEPIKSIEKHKTVPVFKVKFSDGGIQIVTAAHRYYTIKKGSHSKHVMDYRLDELEVGDYVRVEPTLVLNSNPNDYELGLKRGILLGDGCYTNYAMKQNIVKIASNVEDVEYNLNIKKLFSSEKFRKDDTSSGGKTVNMILSNGKTLIQELQLIPSYSYQKTFEITTVQTMEMALGIIDGLLATDGDILLKSNHPQIRFTTSSEALAQNIRRLLLMIGCHGRIFKSFVDDGGVINGRKIIRKNVKYNVIVSGESSRRLAKLSRIGQISPIKGKKINELRKEWLTTGNTWKAKIVSIEAVGTATVYDLYCERSDTWITDGYVQRGCGEQPLLPYEACNLGSVNLGMFVKNGTIDYKYLGEVVDKSVHFLDNVIEANFYPISKIEEAVKGNRKIGLGVMGFADMLIKLGVPYGSEKSIRLAREVMGFINENAREASERLARERGAFPNFDKSIYAGKKKIRNSTRTTIAPTGTISTLLDASGGIEPIFSIVEYRKSIFDKDGKAKYKFRTIHPAFKEFIDQNKLDEESLCVKIAQHEGSIQELDLPEDVKRLFVVAHDLGYDKHLKVQAAFQEHTDNAVSKTINFPETSSVEDVYGAYKRAYEFGLKGITIYRNRSRSGQVLTSGKEKPAIVMKKVKKPAALNISPALKYDVPTGFGKVHITIADKLYRAKDGKIYLFPNEDFQSRQPIGSSTSVEFAESGLERTMILKSEDPDYIKLIENLKSVSGDRSYKMGEVRVNSLSHAVGMVFEAHLLRSGVIEVDEREASRGKLVQKVRKEDCEELPREESDKLLLEYIVDFFSEDKKVVEHDVTANIKRDALCNDCGAELRHEAGCHGGFCTFCGYSECG